MGRAPGACGQVVERVRERWGGVTSVEEALRQYEKVLAVVWVFASSVLGPAAAVVMERALERTREKHGQPPFLQVRVDPGSLSLDGSRPLVLREDPERVHQVFQDLIHNFLTLLAVLTGDILFPPMVQELERCGLI